MPKIPFLSCIRHYYWDWCYSHSTLNELFRYGVGVKELEVEGKTIKGEGSEDGYLYYEALGLPNIFLVDCFKGLAKVCCGCCS